jgi:hypothetical protein
VAWELAASGAPADRVRSAARLALSGETLLREVSGESPVFLCACASLIWCDEYHEVRHLLELALDDERSRGSIVGSTQIAVWLAEVHVRGGSIPDAIAHASTAVEVDTPISTISSTLGAAWLALARIEQGEARRDPAP